MKGCILALIVLMSFTLPMAVRAQGPTGDFHFPRDYWRPDNQTHIAVTFLTPGMKYLFCWDWHYLNSEIGNWGCTNPFLGTERGIEKVITIPREREGYHIRFMLYYYSTSEETWYRVPISVDKKTWFDPKPINPCDMFPGSPPLRSCYRA